MEYPRCCSKSPKYKITYDCGPEDIQTILVCEEHYAEEPFRRFIMTIEKIQDSPN